jgi:hypothetical protein
VEPGAGFNRNTEELSMKSFEKGELLARRAEQALEAVLFAFFAFLIGAGTIAGCLLGAAIGLG